MNSIYMVSKSNVKKQFTSREMYLSFLLPPLSFYLSFSYWFTLSLLFLLENMSKSIIYLSIIYYLSIYHVSINHLLSIYLSTSISYAEGSTRYTLVFTFYT